MKVELDHRSPWELLVATTCRHSVPIRGVNQVTPKLFRLVPQPADYAEADPTELEALIRPTGFFKTKAKNLIHCAKVVTERFHGRCPRRWTPSRPCWGRTQTANVLLGNAFEKPAIVVDTHVKRVSGRLHLTRHTDPEKIESDLQQLMPARQWTEGSQRLLLHGRYVCSRANRNAGSARSTPIAIGKEKLHDDSQHDRLWKKDVASDNAGDRRDPLGQPPVSGSRRAGSTIPRAIEDPIRKAVQQRCLRGRVDVSVSVHVAGGSLKPCRSIKPSPSSIMGRSKAAKEFGAKRHHRHFSVSRFFATSCRLPMNRSTRNTWARRSSGALGVALDGPRKDAQAGRGRPGQGPDLAPGRDSHR